MANKNAFTLLELIVVIIIIGTLGTFGFNQYSNMLERGRAAEARANLGMLRKLQLGYKMEHSSYAEFGYNPGPDRLDSGLPLADPDGATLYDGECLNSNYYFEYFCVGEGICLAMRCYIGGKSPDINYSKRYYLRMSMDGTLNCFMPGGFKCSY